MTTATHQIAAKRTPQKHLEEVASRGIRPGVYANESEILSNFAAEAEADDRLLASMPQIKPGRPTKSAERIELVTTTVKLPKNLLSELRAAAAIRGTNCSTVVREILAWARTRGRIGKP